LSAKAALVLRVMFFPVRKYYTGCA
jgi:hypothetical protein